MTLILQGTDNSVSSPAVQGGTAGATTGVYYPSSNQVALATNGTLALVVNSSQAVGVGISNPTTKLHVAGGVVRSSNTANTTYCELQNDGVYGSGNLYIVAPASSSIYTYANNTLSTTLSTAGNLTFNQLNSGIIFNNSSASVASTLNDYETGTWTPAFRTDGTQPSISYGQQTGSYVKIGRLVYCTGYILISSISSQGTGIVQLGGLPFTVGQEQTALNFSDGGAMSAYWTNTGATQIYGYSNGSSNTVTFRGNGNTNLYRSFTTGSIRQDYLLFSMTYYANF